MKSDLPEADRITFSFFYPDSNVTKMMDHRNNSIYNTLYYFRRYFTNMEDFGRMYNIYPSQILPYFESRNSELTEYNEDDESNVDFSREKYPYYVATWFSVMEFLYTTPFPFIQFPVLEHYLFNPPQPRDLHRHTVLAYHDVGNIEALYISSINAEKDEEEYLARNYNHLSPVYFNENHKHIFNKISSADYKYSRLKGNAGGYKYYYRMNIPLNVDNLESDPLWIDDKFIFGSDEYYRNFIEQMSFNKPEQLLQYNSDEFKDTKLAGLMRPHYFAKKFNEVKAERYQKNKAYKFIVELGRVLKTGQNWSFRNMEKRGFKNILKHFRNLDFLDISNVFLLEQERKKKIILEFEKGIKNGNLRRGDFCLLNFLDHSKIPIHRRFKRQMNNYYERYNKLYGFLFIKDNELLYLGKYKRFIPNLIRYVALDTYFKSFSSLIKPNSKRYFSFIFNKQYNFSSPKYCNYRFFLDKEINLRKLTKRERRVILSYLNNSGSSYIKDMEQVFNNRLRAYKFQDEREQYEFKI